MSRLRIKLGDYNGVWGFRVRRTMSKEVLCRLYTVELTSPLLQFPNINIENLGYQVHTDSNITTMDLSTLHDLDKLIPEIPEPTPIPEKRNEEKEVKAKDIHTKAVETHKMIAAPQGPH